MTYKEIFEHALAGGEFVDKYGCVWRLDVARDQWQCILGREWQDVGEPLLRDLHKHEPERVAYMHKDPGQKTWGPEYTCPVSDFAHRLKLTYRGDELVDSEVVKS